MTNNISEIEIILETSDGPRSAGNRSRILAPSRQMAPRTWRDTYLAIILSEVTLYQHYIITYIHKD